MFTGRPRGSSRRLIYCPFTPAKEFAPRRGSGGTADALASGASWSNPVGVQIPPSAPEPKSSLNGRFRIDRQWVFPATRFYVDRSTGERRRHHRRIVLQRADPHVLNQGGQG